MASLKDLKVRIKSVKSTQKITKAMKMVAASKLRRAQESAEAARPFALRMDRVIAGLTAGMAGREDAPRLMTGTGDSKVQLLVVMTAERGLCGAFNSSIVRLARSRTLALLAEGKEVKILCVGRKGRDALRRDLGRYIIDTIEMVGVRRIGYVNAETVTDRVLELFAEGAFDVATIFFARFQSAISQVPTAQQVIPLPPAAEGDGSADLGGAIYDYEPEESEILEALLPRNLAVQIFKALLENAASEQGARMSAMDNATRNAGDMINRLTLIYNRSRQAAITKELIEIISGAEAL